METVDLAVAITELTLKFPVLEARHVTCFIRMVFEKDLLNPNKLSLALRSMVAEDLVADKFCPFVDDVRPRDSSTANRGRRVRHTWRPLPDSGAGRDLGSGVSGA